MLYICFDSRNGFSISKLALKHFSHQNHSTNKKVRFHIWGERSLFQGARKWGESDFKKWKELISHSIGSKASISTKISIYTLEIMTSHYKWWHGGDVGPSGQPTTPAIIFLWGGGANIFWRYKKVSYICFDSRNGCSIPKLALKHFFPSKSLHK